MQLQLRSIPEDSGCAEMFAFRGLTVRVSDLAGVIMESMADGPQASVSELQVIVYRESDPVEQPGESDSTSDRQLCRA